VVTVKVFISWSGERSQGLALALRDWLPLVLHYVDPWLSEADVAAGDRWAQEVAKELEASNFGIICVTPENMGAPWVLFEAGALAKSMQGARVVPLLHNLEFSDITGPLAQFQAKKVERSGLGEVIQSINHAAESPVPDDRAKQLFAALWPEFENRLAVIAERAPTAKHMRPQHEILEELVTSVRGLDSRFRELEGAVSDPRSRSMMRRRRHIHPMMLEEIAHMASEDGDDPVALLLFGSLVRDEFPWLQEIFSETYRSIRDGDPKDTPVAIGRLRRMLKMLGRGSKFDEFGGSSKEAHMLMMELPMVLDHFLHRVEMRRLKRPPDAPSDDIEVEGE
jgi:hypothetical protein